MAWSNLSRHARGYGTAWDKLRAQILKRDQYLCQSCKKLGRIKSANQVDHVIPKDKGGTDEPSNLQSLCKPCHDAKGLDDKGYKQKPTIGLSGWPV